MSGRLLAALLLAFACDLAGAANAASEYTLRYDAGTETMAVRLCVPRAAPSLHFSADRGAPQYVDALAREGGAALTRDSAGWSAADWHAGDCIAYRAAFGRMGDAGRRAGAARRGSTVLVDPDVWLLRADGGGDVPAEATVELPDGFAISTPWHPLPSDGAARRFSIPPTPRDWLAQIAVGRFDEHAIALPGSTLRLSILDGASAEEQRKLKSWLPKVGRAAATAFGTLPLADVQLLIWPIDDSREAVQFGQSRRGQGQGLTLFVDAKRPAAEFDRDWVAVHELSHMFHPYLDDAGSWLAEGLATYYQNVLRARAGLLTPAQAWEQLDAGFGRGRRDTPGRAVALEDADSYMRVYWSGTAYWLETDVELRRTSGNRLGIDEALRRFDACCLPDSRGWTPQDFVAKLDALVGTDVFARRYAAYRARRDFPDLAPLYAALGIRRESSALGFADDAPAADVRRAITTSAR